MTQAHLDNDPESPLLADARPDETVRDEVGAERGRYAAHYENNDGTPGDDRAEAAGTETDTDTDTHLPDESDDSYGAVQGQEAEDTARQSERQELPDALAVANEQAAVTREATLGEPAAAATAATVSGPGAALVHDSEDLRSRWDRAQANFVDDPRDAVQQAGGLVEDVLDKLRESFGDERGRLEQTWASGEQPSTEDLRLAIQRYRDFFQRLLAA